MSLIGQSKDDQVHQAGDHAGGSGSLLCAECSFPLSLDPADEIPQCSNCGSSRFHRASMFEQEQPTLSNLTIARPMGRPGDWLAGIRDSLELPGKYLALFADGRSRVMDLDDGWSRIGRSPSADIRLDDPTVSRRHAVVVKTPEGDLRVLDDRSMNGILVNGDQVDWSSLEDGDQLQIGRYTLHVIESAGAPANTA